MKESGVTKRRSRAPVKRGVSGTEKTAAVEPGALAGIEYVGLSGISQECQAGVLRLIQYGDRISRARILSASHEHCFLLTVNYGDVVAVKSGFSSGYAGEGPRTFAYVLRVLAELGVQIDEYVVPAELIQRLDSSALTKQDLKMIDSSRPILPERWSEFALDHRRQFDKDENVWENFPVVVPFAIIDSRITNLAMGFSDSPDGCLLDGYRRLEDIVRARTSINEHGTKLFSQAFSPKIGKLTWTGLDESERIGRMTLFTGAYMAYRNRRAHRESRENRQKLLAEFLLLNHLYLLEKQSVEADDTDVECS